MSERQRDWQLSAEGFTKLLSFLDSDRERAADSYEQIRRRLMKFFQWRGAADPGTLTDRTIDRVALRLLRNDLLTPENPYVFFHGVALNVLREHWREPERQVEPIEDAKPIADPAAQNASTGPMHRERLLTLLEGCIDKLPKTSRELVVGYHGDGFRIDARKKMARRLGIPLNALRIRVYRIRVALEACVTNRMKQFSENNILQ